MSKLWIGSKQVDEAIGGPNEHLYVVYDPDGDPYSGDELFWRGGPKGDNPLNFGNIEIENWTDALTSEDSHYNKSDGSLVFDPFDDRNFTEVILPPGKTPEDVRDELAAFARDLGTEDATGRVETNVPYTLPVYIDGEGGVKAIPAENSNTTVRSGLENSDIDIASNLPFQGGQGSGNGRLPQGVFPGSESYYTASDGTVELKPGDQIVWSDGGDNTYVTTPDPFDPGKIVIVEDTDTGTLDKIEIRDVLPEDVSFQRTPSGDLHIYFPWDANGDPSIIVIDQWDENGIPRINTIHAIPQGGGTPFIIPLNDPDDFPVLSPAPLPGWAPDVQVPFDDAQTADPSGSPLIVDLDMDGVEATLFDATATATFFDINTTGFAVQTAWVGADDGLLARDVNGNGTIDDASELFGSATVDGFAILALLDSNGDLVIDANDTAWPELVIWKDANADALTDSGELQSLSFYNIESIDLAGVTPSTQTVGGNEVSHTSTLTYTDGTTADVWDVWFVHDTMNTQYAGDLTLDVRALFLPSLRGFGHLAGLHIAMSQNETLLQKVQDLAANWSFASFADNAALDAEVGDILLHWAGVENVDPASRGDFVDARHLEFLEALTGEDWLFWNLLPDPLARGGDKLEVAWSNALNTMKAALAVQLGADALFGGQVSYNAWTGEIEGTPDLDQQAVNDLLPYATAPGVDAESYWLAVAEFLHHTKDLNNLSLQEEGWLDTAIQASDSALSWTIIEGAYYAGLTSTLGQTFIGTTGDDTINGTYADDDIDADQGNDEAHGLGGNDIIWGRDGHDHLTGNEGHDELHGGLGNDILEPGPGGDIAYGDQGDDTYVYSGGSDAYQDTGGTDTIEFAPGITAADLSYARVGSSMLLITVQGYGTIEIDGQFLFPAYNIETLKFADLSTIDLLTLPGLVTHGSGGADTIQGITSGAAPDDTIYGYGGDDVISGRSGDDILDGGTGNDTLIGEAGNNTYVASPGYDIVVPDTGIDTILIPAAYGPSDLSVFRLVTATGQYDMHITVSGLGQIEVQGQFSNFGSFQAEYISFADGSPAIDLLALPVESLGTSGDDIINGITQGGSINDIMRGLDGNDYLDGGAGIDKVDYSWSAAGVTVNLNNGTADKDGDGITDDTLINIEDITGSNFNDTLIGNNAAANVIEGLDGNDALQGRDSGDTLIGGNGNDDLRGHGGDDLLDGGPGSDTFYGSEGNDTLLGGDGNDYTMRGGTGDDVIDGGDGDDQLRGEEGNDTLIGGRGIDRLDGETGIDTADFSTVDATGHGVITNLATTNTADDGYGNAERVLRVENVIGSMHDDTLLGDDFDNDIKGGDGSDTIKTYDGNDNLVGGQNIDFLFGGAGNDTLNGGSGVDALFGQGGADQFIFDAASALTGSDNIKDFNEAEGDTINIADVITGYDPVTQAIADFVRITDNGTHSYLSVDADGGGDNFIQIAQISATTGLTDVEALETAGTLITI